MRPLLLALVALAAPAAARGQVEITALGGFRFGGDVDTTVPGSAATKARYEVADSGSFGIHVGYAVGDGEIELSYARQNSKLQTSDLFAGVPVFDLALETWQLGGNVLFGEPDARLQPFVGLAAGLTRLLPGPSALSDETRFVGSCSGGAKLWLGRRVGLRFEARGLFTLLDSNSRTFCTNGFCTILYGNSQVISQGEVRGGLILRF
jgi:outer membrane protein with beta-barrel domain